MTLIHKIALHPLEGFEDFIFKIYHLLSISEISENLANNLYDIVSSALGRFVHYVLYFSNTVEPLRYGHLPQPGS